MALIVLMAGLPGTGKSTLARALAERLGGVVLSKDVVRAALFPPEFVEYSAGQDDFCQSLLLETAGYLLARHPDLTIFLDGRTFSRGYQRDAVAAFAARAGARFAVVECVCPEATALARLDEDLRLGRHPARNRTPELYRAVRASFEPIGGPKLVIDTGRSLGGCVDDAIEFLRRSG